MTTFYFLLKNGSTSTVKKYSLSHVINRILHSWSFYMKFIKLAKGSFSYFIWNNHKCKIPYLYNVACHCIDVNAILYKRHMPAGVPSKHTTLKQYRFIIRRCFNVVCPLGLLFPLETDHHRTISTLSVLHVA